ncbi:hypothetical protein DK66_3149 [Brucella suis 1330]|nr:hypothetical protein DK66_3149 [Brucella suis 1330]
MRRSLCKFPNHYSISVVAINLFTTLMAFLRFNRKCCDRTGIKTLQADGVAGFLAETISAIIQTAQCSIDLGDQLALSVTSTKLDCPIRFGGSPIRQVGMVCVFLLERIKRFARFTQNIILPCNQFCTEIRLLPFIHERFVFSGPIVKVN